MNSETKYRIVTIGSAAETVGIFITIIMITAGCVYDLPRVYGLPGSSPRPETPWTPPQRAVDEQLTLQRENKSAIPPGILMAINKLSLAEIVDIALQSNNQTRAAWSQARAAAANYGSKRGSYFPEVNGSVSGNRQKTAVFGQRAISPYSAYSVSGSLTWLLFDFGGRSASIEEGREILFAADWTHASSIQNVILEVELAYYNYGAMKSRVEAQQATVDEAKTNLSAANDRHGAGLATIADVLQAQTGLSQALLTFETEKGQLMATRGALATAMGLPADFNLDIDLPVGDVPAAETEKTIAECLELALRERPDLAAARAQALAAAAHVKSVRSQMLPSLSAGGAIGRVYFDSLSSGGSFTYNAGLGITIPIFSGFSRRYDLLAAGAEADAARAVLHNAEDNVRLQVWTSYYNLETAGQTVRTSDDLFKSASQNYDVALGRYKAGVGSIIDLLTAQAALQSGRAQRVAARADWWQAVAQLAHDTGTLQAAPPDGTGPDGKLIDRNNK